MNNKIQKIIINLYEILNNNNISKKENITILLFLLFLFKKNKNNYDLFKITNNDLSNNYWLDKIFNSLSESYINNFLKFQITSAIKKIEYTSIVKAIDFCFKLSGIIDYFDPTDCMTYIDCRNEDEFVIPTELADLIVEVANIKEGMKVYTPWDHTGQLSSRIAKIGGSVYSELSILNPIPELINLFNETNTNIVHSDPIIDPIAVEAGDLKKFDTTVAIPPFFIKYDNSIAKKDIFNRFPEKVRSGIILSIRHIMAQTSGRAIIIVPNMFLYNLGSSLKLRKDIITNKLLEAVIHLPPGLNKKISMPLSIIIINMHKQYEHILFVDATTKNNYEMISKVKSRLKNIDLIKKQVDSRSKSNISDVFPISFYKPNESYTLLYSQNFYNDDFINIKKGDQIYNPSCQLGSIIDVIRPVRIKQNLECQQDLYKKDIFIINSSDIPEYGYLECPEKKIEADVKFLNHDNFVKAHDIIFIHKGDVGKIAIASKEIAEKSIIINQSSIILRLKKNTKVDPRLLVTYLKSEYCQAKIKDKVLYSPTVQMIHLKDLLEIDVIIPHQNEVSQIIRAFEDQVSIQKEISRLKKKQIDLTRNFWNFETINFS